MIEPILVDEAVVVHSSCERVWECLADPRLLGSWWPGMHLAFEVGSTFVEIWADDDGIERRTSGTVVSCVPRAGLVLTWIDDDWPAATRVEIRLEDAGAERSRIRLRHAGWDALPNGADLVEAHRTGWRHHLATWAATAEDVD